MPPTPSATPKAEYLSAVLEGVFILLAAFFIAKEALPRLLHPTPSRTWAPGLWSASSPPP
jgi:Co/Zn/Cd efflux system component